MNEPEPISALCEAWLELKEQEKIATGARLVVEDRLIAALGFNKTDGSQTFKPEGFKVECKAALTYKLDTAVWDQIANQLPDGYRPVKVKIEPDPAGIKYLQKEHAGLWQVAAPAFTSKPAKVGVTITKVEAQ